MLRVKVDGKGVEVAVEGKFEDVAIEWALITKEIMESVVKIRGGGDCPELKIMDDYYEISKMFVIETVKKERGNHEGESNA